MSTVTDLLQVVERNTLSELEAATQPKQRNASEGIKTGDAFLPQGVATGEATTEFPLAGNLSSNQKQPDPLLELQSLKVSPKRQLVSLTDGESLTAEKFRFLGVRLRHLRREQPLQKVLITSTIPHEGKSMVAANLACTLARKKQQKTLLLEGDVRRPSLSQIFGLDRLPGLCEWLQSDHAQLKNIYHLEGPDLWFLPAGSITSNPLELLQSGRLSVLINQLNTLFDWIIIDSPPILPLADTSVWSRFADGILLVARNGSTRKRQLQRGLEALDSKKLIGALLNSSHNSPASEHYHYYGASTSGADNLPEK
ncbi:MAG TPA: CpsD/CapB family tyrosine-protein kinase [Pseudacidobacterium sp.]|nr:CpsD/CapB family tyrosine-protein kinase [Pseudacidobacterium sp.]